MIQSIIVEDDSMHSERLYQLLAKSKTFIDVKKICSTIDEAILAIEKYKPQLVFLDISLNGDDKGGFRLLQQIEHIDFGVIFTTAHVDENISEIRRCGLCCIVKPYIFSEVEDAMRKYEEKQKESEEKKVKTLKSNLLIDRVEDRVIYINHNGELFPIRVKEILYCFSNDAILSFVINTENSELLKTDIRRHNLTTKNDDHKHFIEWERHMTMKELERDFRDLNFCRIHNKFLVNMLHVRKFVAVNNGGGMLKLSNDENLEVSAAGRKEFLKQTGRK